MGSNDGAFDSFLMCVGLKANIDDAVGESAAVAEFALSLHSEFIADLRSIAS